MLIRVLEGVELLHRGEDDLHVIIRDRELVQMLMLCIIRA
jgi:hypothetical protein